MKRACAYYRMSSDQQEASITDQRIAVEKWAAANGYRIVREYVDEAISGWRDDRKAFQRLIADAPSGEFEAVLCWDQDRFSRFPVLEANHYWFILERAGVHLITVAQGRLDFSTLAGWLTASIAQHGKSEYCRDLARNTTRGLRKRKLAGDWVGSAPLGYVLSGGRLDLGESSKVELVRRIFSMRAQGIGYQLIAKTLNREGVPTPRGKTWSQFTIKHVLQRDAYLGCVVIGKHARAKYERLTDGIVRIDGTHPAIITQEIWDQCRAVDNQLRKAHTRNGSEGAPLGGLLKCGCCGWPMYPITQDRWKYYVCGNYHQRGECHRCAVPQDRANVLIFKHLRSVLYLDNLEGLQAAIADELSKSKTPTIDRKDIEKQIASIDVKIRNATERLVSVAASLVPSIEAKLIEMLGQRDALVKQLAEKPAERTTSVNDVMKELRSLDTILTHGKPSTQRQALSRYIREVRIDFAHHETTKSGKVRYRPTGGRIFFTTDCQPSERTSHLCKSAHLLLPASAKISQREWLAA